MTAHAAMARDFSIVRFTRLVMLGSVLVLGLVGAGSDRLQNVRPPSPTERAIGRRVRKTHSLSLHEVATKVVGQGLAHLVADYINQSVRWLPVLYSPWLKTFAYALIMSVFFDSPIRCVSLISCYVQKIILKGVIVRILCLRARQNCF